MREARLAREWKELFRDLDHLQQVGIHYRVRIWTGVAAVDEGGRGTPER
jgi:hypothetical protein